MKLTLIAFLSTITLPVFSQAPVREASDTVELKFAEAVKIGLQKNVNLNQQKNNLFSRQVQKNRSAAAFLPTVAINADANHTDGNQPNPNGGELIDISVDQVSAGIRADLTLFNGFNNINTLAQNKNLFRAQSALVVRTEQEVIFNTTNQYLQVLLDQELLRIAIGNHQAQKALLEQLRGQVELGSMAESQLYAQDALVQNMQVTALRARITLQNDMALLSQTLQLDPAIPFKVAFPEMTENVKPLSPASLDSLYAIAQANRQDLIQARYTMEANDRGYKASINGYLPSVRLYAGYGSQYVSTLEDQGFGDFKNQFSRIFPTTYYGVGLTVPLFDRLQTRSTRVANRVLYDNSKLQYESVEKNVKIDVQRAFNNYNAAIEAYNAAQVGFNAGQLTLRTQQESFSLGVSDQVALANANQTYILAAASKAQAEVVLVFQKIMMEYALGTLKRDFLF